jgi:hypothetical protein
LNSFYPLNFVSHNMGAVQCPDLNPYPLPPF